MRANVEGRLEKIERNEWLAPLRGSFPRVPTVTALPTAGEHFRFCLLGVKAAAGAADVLYCCMKDAADAYAWEVVVSA